MPGVYLCFGEGNCLTIKPYPPDKYQLTCFQFESYLSVIWEPVKNTGWTHSEKWPGGIPLEGGLIITDGSNSRQSNYEKMTSPKGVNKFCWHLEPFTSQPLIKQQDGRSYNKDRLLQVIQVKPTWGEQELPVTLI